MAALLASPSRSGGLLLDNPDSYNVATAVDALSLVTKTATVQAPRSEGLLLANPQRSAGLLFASAAATVIDIWASDDGTWATWATAWDSLFLNAGLSGLNITPQSPTVSLNISPDATRQELTITPLQADITLPVSATAGFDTLQITGQTATVNAGNTTTNTVQALAITPLKVTINNEFSIEATTDDLSISGKNIGLPVTVKTAALSITERSASVQAGRIIEAARAVLSITTYPVTILKNIWERVTDQVSTWNGLQVRTTTWINARLKEIDVGIASLGVTPLKATITALASHTVDATTASLSLTEQLAAISQGSTTNADTAALGITEQTATVNYHIQVENTVAALAITENIAGIGVGTGIPAGIDSLSITPNITDIKFSKSLTTIPDTLAITTKRAQVGTSFDTGALLADPQRGLGLLFDAPIDLPIPPNPIDVQVGTDSLAITGIVQTITKPSPSGRILNLDFEGGTIGQLADTDPSGAHYAYSKTTFSTGPAGVGPHSGSQCCEAHLDIGDTGSETWGAWFRWNEGTTWPSHVIGEAFQGDEIWMRIWVHMDIDYSTCKPKGMRALIKPAGGSYDVYPMNDGVRVQNWVDLSAFMINNCANPSDCPEIDFAPEATQGWESWEMYAYAHSTPGQGIYRFWRNGVLLLEDTQTPTIRTSTDYINSVGMWIESFQTQPGQCSGSPVSQSTYLDDVRIQVNGDPGQRDAAGNPMIGTYTPPIDPESFTPSLLGITSSSYPVGTNLPAGYQYEPGAPTDWRQVYWTADVVNRPDDPTNVCYRFNVQSGETAAGMGGWLADDQQRMKYETFTAQIKTYFPSGYDLDAGGGGLKFIRWRGNAGDNRRDIDVLYNGSSGFSLETSSQISWDTITFPIRFDEWQTWTFQVYSDDEPGGTAWQKMWGQNENDSQATLLITLDSSLTLTHPVYPQNYGTLNDGANPRFDGFLFITYWNPTATGGAPATQSAYIDDVYVTQESVAKFPFSNGLPERQ